MEFKSYNMEVEINRRALECALPENLWEFVRWMNPQNVQIFSNLSKFLEERKYSGKMIASGNHFSQFPAGYDRNGLINFGLFRQLQHGLLMTVRKFPYNRLRAEISLCLISSSDIEEMSVEYSKRVINRALQIKADLKLSA